MKSMGDGEIGMRIMEKSILRCSFTDNLASGAGYSSMLGENGVLEDVFCQNKRHSYRVYLLKIM